MQISKIIVFGTDLTKVQVFHIELIDGMKTNVANQVGASGYNDVIEFINNPANKTKVEFIDINFLQNKQVLLNIRLEYLSVTDWYIIRQQETNMPIPHIITTKRTKARTEINLIQPIQIAEELIGLNLEPDEYFS